MEPILRILFAVLPLRMISDAVGRSVSHVYHTYIARPTTNNKKALSSSTPSAGSTYSAAEAESKAQKMTEHLQNTEDFVKYWFVLFSVVKPLYLIIRSNNYHPSNTLLRFALGASHSSLTTSPQKMATSWHSIVSLIPEPNRKSSLVHPQTADQEDLARDPHPLSLHCRLCCRHLDLSMAMYDQVMGI
jgi:hypothetical protein